MSDQKSAEVILSASNISVSRAGRKLLSDVSIELRAGEILALLGPNGAGKSTLLGTLTGDVTEDEGRVTFRGKDLNEWSLKDLAKKRSVLLQDNQVLFPFTVLQVVEMGRSPWSRTPEEDNDPEAIAWAIEKTDIIHLGSRRIPTLSGGERARTAFARTITAKTGVLLLDEPTAALDLAHQEDLLRLTRELADQGNAILIIIHDINLASAYADRIALLKQGELFACGTPSEVLTAESLSYVYNTDVEIIKHPVTGKEIVLPLRG